MLNLKNLFRVDPEYAKIMGDCTEQLREIIKLNEKINMLDKANQNLQASISGNKAVITRQSKEIVGLRQENEILKEENKKLSPRDLFEDWTDVDKIQIDIEQASGISPLMISSLDILENQNKRTGIIPPEVFVKLKDEVK